VRIRKVGVVTIGLACLIGVAIAQSATPAEWKDVEDAIGRPGQAQPGDVIRFGLPRKDLHVTLDGVEVKAGFALGSWVAFKKDGATAMVMGDLVLTQDEVEPVMLKLQQGGIEQSALHNHLLGETPHVMYMHVQGHGDAIKLAKTIHDAIALTKTPAPDAAPSQPTDLGIDQKQIEQALGRNGKVNGGVLQFGVPRSEKITDSGMEIPPARSCDRHQYPIDGERQGCNHRRLRSSGQRGQSCHSRTPRERNRSHGDTQPYVDGGASTLLYALLGKR
jgi:hypothetical protein